MDTGEHIDAAGTVTVRTHFPDEDTVMELDLSDFEILSDEWEEPTVPYARVSPQGVQAILKLCDDLWRSGSKRAALRRLRQTARREPASLAVQDRLVDALVALGRRAEAIHHLYDFAERMEGGRPDLVRHALERIVAIEPRTEPARSLLLFEQPSIRGARRWFAHDLPTRPQRV